MKKHIIFQIFEKTNKIEIKSVRPMKRSSALYLYNILSNYDVKGYLTTHMMLEEDFNILYL